MTRSRSERGHVYVVIHPSFPHFVKVGCAKRPNRRLATFNTACPHRAFRIHSQFNTTDQYQLEAEVHSRLSLWRTNGEWFEVPPERAASVIREVREELHL